MARAVLGLLAVAGVLSLLLVALSWGGVLRPLRVASNSMAPAFAAGDLLIATAWPIDGIVAGDIVVVANPRADGLEIAHRVVTRRTTPDGAELRLQGDANAVPDQQPYEVGRTVPRVWFSIPGGAVRYAALTRPEAGLPILAGLALLALAATLVAGREAPQHGGAKPPGLDEGGRR